MHEIWRKLDVKIGHHQRQPSSGQAGEKAGWFGKAERWLQLPSRLSQLKPGGGKWQKRKEIIFDHADDEKVFEDFEGKGSKNASSAGFARKAADGEGLVDRKKPTWWAAINHEWSRKHLEFLQDFGRIINYLATVNL